MAAYFLNMNYHTIEGYSYEMNICALGLVCFAGIVLIFSKPEQISKLITKIINFILRKR